MPHFHFSANLSLSFLFMLFFVANFCQSQHLVSPQRKSKAMNDTACNLPQLAKTYDVDKMDHTHLYQSVYCDIFKPYRYAGVTMLEIGFGCGHPVHGRSALMWSDFLKNVQYYSIDYTPGNILKAQSCYDDFTNQNPKHNVKKIWIGDQSNHTFLQAVKKEYKNHWDIIIDDGGHYFYQQIASFIELWPMVSPGGYYVIEDLQAEEGFSKVFSRWIHLLAFGAAVGKSGDLTMENYMKDIPYGAKIIACAYQICYLRKASTVTSYIPQSAAHPVPSQTCA